MRPVLLEMSGFASFREKTEVNFAGADYFALVGPTGAGKSTVIDALTFALYGSVARWDHEGLVAPALAPTTNRGTVRLVFDAGGARYHVVREVRRSGGKKPTVSVKSVRLERLADPESLGGPDDAADLVAADSEVTPAVEGILGLTFKHFCTCVALPQGDFAEFLHAKAAERQKILIKLLGLEVYERIARRAGVTEAKQRQRAEVLTEQLGGFADATPEAVEAAEARVTALEALGARVDAALPGLNDAVRAHDDARALVETLQRELAVLDALDRPDGVEDLENRRQAAADAVAAARTRLAEAETADEAARAELRSAPARAELERVRAAREELGAAEKALPGLGEAAEAAKKAKEAADASVAEAVKAVEAARETRDTTARAAEEAATRATRVRQESDRLGALRAPADLADLSDAAGRTAKRVEAAVARLAKAETADAEAREALSAQPDGSELTAARNAAHELAEICAEQRKAAPERAAHRAELEQAQAELARLDTEIAEADRALTAAQQADQALALRAGLAVGHPCPVCEQDVETLPSHDGHAHLAEARQRLDRANAARAQAETAVRKLERTVDRDGDALAVAVDRAERCRRLLPDLGETSFADPAFETVLEKVTAGLEKALAKRTEVATAARSADAELVAARAERTDAQAAADVVGESLASAREALRAARDPLVELGAPAVDADDVVAGWASLTKWAETARGERATALGELEASAEAAAKDARIAADALSGAEREAEARRRRATDASLAEQAARTELLQTTRRRDELTAALADAPPAKVVEQQLARVAVLEKAAAEADAVLKTARTDAKTASDRQTEVGREADAARQRLSRARDPLVGLGAPPLDGDNLLAAWTSLTDWAGGEAAKRRERLKAATDAESRTAEALRAAEQAVVDDVTALGVPFEGGQVRERVPVAVATARARADGDHTELRRRLEQVEGLRGEIAEAESGAQVAKLLADLLRSDKFPRWLIAGALDTLVAEASASLLELSGGQFELTHDKGDFLVVDHNEADARRPVKTLSGGETFQASLALALALSSQLGAMAAAGATKLESIFLDEGFGTLDEATLDVVASTLENLAAGGRRMVGVITHVPALAERVPVRFHVSRDGGGSHITREGA